jgi:electron transfer flavoprotein-quinone oxidoreductase
LGRVKADFEYDVVIVGGGPAGLSAGVYLGRKGVKTLLIERGRFCGAKNLFGGVVYTESIKKLVPEFPNVEPFPCERQVTEEGYLLLTEKGYVKLTYSKEDKTHSFTAFRPKFDSFLADVAQRAGVDLAPKTKVVDFLKDDNGNISGVIVDRPKSFFDSSPASISAKVVILAEGVNRVLSQKAGLYSRDFQPEEVVLSVKEVLQLPKGELEKRLGLKEDEGLALEILGFITQGYPGLGFLYTNKNSISFGIGVFLSELAKNRVRPYELLERAKTHPFFQRLFEGAEVLEYGAHLIPEWGYKGFPKFYSNGVLVCGDAGGFVNPLFREGTNLAIYSGLLAGETAFLALEKGDFSEKTLKVYEEKLKESYFYKDLALAKNMKDLFLRNKHIFSTYPELLYEAMSLYFSAQGKFKRDVIKEIISLIKKKRGFLGVLKDLLSFARLFW